MIFGELPFFCEHVFFFLHSPKGRLVCGLQPSVPINKVFHGLVLVVHDGVAGKHQHLPKEAGHSTHQKGHQGEGGCGAAMSLLSWCRKRGWVLGLAISEIRWG